MGNLMSTIYIGYITEVILKNSKPTLELRIRVPSIHGISAAAGLPLSKLPIAKPMVIPGLEYNAESFLESVKKLNKVFVIFESGDYDKPIYFGVKGNSDLYNFRTNTSYMLYYDSLGDFPAVGNKVYLYRSLDNNLLYYWDNINLLYKLAVYSGTGSGDALIGTVRAYIDSGIIFGLRLVDGIQLITGDKAFVYGISGIDDAIYSVNSGTWTKFIDISLNQVISIDDGLVNGGSMLKVLDAGILVVKKSEITKWQLAA